MKKRVLSLFTALALLVAATACASNSPPAVAPAQSDGTQELSGRITVWSWELPFEYLQQQAEAFKLMHPKVDFVFEEMGIEQVYSKMTTSLQSGVGLPDVVSLEGEQMAKFGGKFTDKFVDLGDVVVDEDFLPVKVAEVTVNGKQLAFPWDAAPVGMFYRTDLFEQAGIKAADIVTWDDFIAAGLQLKDKTGVAMLPLATSRKDMLFRMMLMQQGEFYFDAAGNTTVNSPEAVRAMEMVKDIYDAGITINDGSWDDFVAAIADSKAACIIDGVWAIGTVKGNTPHLSGKWGVMNLPRFDADKPSGGGSNGGSCIAIPSATNNPQAAIEFVKFAMTDKAANEKAFVDYGLYPSYLPTLDSDLFNQGDAFFGGQKIYQVFREIGESVPSCNFTENFAQVLDISKNAVAKVLLNGDDPKSTLDDLQRELVSKFGK